MAEPNDTAEINDTSAPSQVTATEESHAITESTEAVNLLEAKTSEDEGEIEAVTADEAIPSDSTAEKYELTDDQTEDVTGLKTIVAKGPMEFETDLGSNSSPSSEEANATALNSEEQLNADTEEHTVPTVGNAQDHELEDGFPNMKQGFHTVRVMPSQDQDIETVKVNQQEAETVRVLPTELGLPTLAPQADHSESNGQVIDDLQTVRIMPAFDQDSDVVLEAEQADTNHAEIDTLQTREEADLVASDNNEDSELAQSAMSYQPQETETQISPIGQIETSLELGQTENPKSEDSETED